MLGMGNDSIFVNGSDFVDQALELEELQRRVRREEARIARAMLAGCDPNGRWREARRAMRGRRYMHIEDLVADLNHAAGGFPLELRPLGPRPIDNRIVRRHAGDFLVDLVANAARIRAGVAPMGLVTGRGSAWAMTHEVFIGVERALRLVRAWGPGYRQAAYVLTGRVMELAGLTSRRTRPDGDIDSARIEAVRRALRREPHLDDSAELIIITTFGD